MGETLVNKALERAKKRSRFRNSKGVLVAEGDSWFALPSFDLLDRLREQGYEIHSVANHGDTIESMAYSRDQLDQFCDCLVAVPNAPLAVLLSGGGNDLAGDRFALLLRPKGSGTSGLDIDIVAQVMTRIKNAYEAIIARITECCEAVGFNDSNPVHILIHGYAYPVPDGRGYGGWFFLPGPWLKPALEAQGYTDTEEMHKIVKGLIDQLHITLEGVAEPHAHIHHLDIRECLTGSDNPKAMWSDEMHPSRDGFRRIGAVFDQKIQILNGGARPSLGNNGDRKPK